MVIYEQNYLLKLPVIVAIPENQIKTPTIPVMEYIREVKKLKKWCQDDQAELMAGGLNWEIVADLPVRADAYYKAECNCEATVKWLEIRLRVKARFDSLLPVFRNAYRDTPYLLDRVDQIVACRCVDEPQALVELVSLGASFPRDLGDDFIPEERFSEAMLIQGEYSYLKKKAGDKENRKRIRTVRDQAFTHLKEAVDEVCTRAREVFQKNEARLQGYRAPNFTLGFIHRQHPAAAE